MEPLVGLTIVIILFVILCALLVELLDVGVNVNMDISDRRNQLIYARLMRDIEAVEQQREGKKGQEK